MNKYNIAAKVVKSGYISRKFAGMSQQEVAAIFVATGTYEPGWSHDKGKQGLWRLGNVIFNNSSENEINFFYRVDTEGNKTSKNLVIE